MTLARMLREAVHGVRSFEPGLSQHPLPMLAALVLDACLLVRATADTEQANRKDELTAKIVRLRKELDHCIHLIADGKAPATVVAEFTSHEEQLKRMQDVEASTGSCAPFISRRSG